MAFIHGRWNEHRTHPARKTRWREAHLRRDPSVMPRTTRALTSGMYSSTRWSATLYPTLRQCTPLPTLSTAMSQRKRLRSEKVGVLITCLHCGVRLNAPPKTQKLAKKMQKRQQIFCYPLYSTLSIVVTPPYFEASRCVLAPVCGSQSF